MNQRMRINRSHITCRNDINLLNAPLLELFGSLIPSDEEKVKQKQLLTQLETLVRKEWPDARLFLYGSCANSFGFSKSDIDVCLRMDCAGIDKSEVLLKMANILETNNLQNVQVRNVFAYVVCFTDLFFACLFWKLIWRNCSC